MLHSRDPRIGRHVGSTPLALGLVLVLALLALAGCGDSDDEADDTAADEVTTSVPAGPSAADTTAAPDEDEVEDDLVIVDIADFSFDLASLGVTPVANGYGPEFLSGTIDQFPLSEDQQRSILAAENIAPAFVLNVEAVIDLQPDLVLTSTANAAFWADPMAQIDEAIGVVTIDDSLGWQDRSRAITAAIGREGAYDERIAAAEASIVETAARVEEMGLQGTEVSVLWSFSNVLSAMVTPSLASTTLEAVGLTQPDAQLVEQPESSIEPDYAAATLIAAENLGAHDADALIVLNTADASSVTAEWPDSYPQELISVLTDGPVLAGAYFTWSLNTVVGVEAIVRDINLLLDQMG
ncbi:MAG: hypothetical protein AAGA99_19250 [Actinomycetota bacterium]